MNVKKARVSFDRGKTWEEIRCPFLKSWNCPLVASDYIEVPGEKAPHPEQPLREHVFELTYTTERH